MIQVIETSSPNKELGIFNNKAKVRRTLSKSVIPAVPGEFYDYSSKFTDKRPLYALMSCKANKDRPITAAKVLGREVNLFFLFGSSTKVQVYAIKTAHASGLLSNSINSESFGETWIAPARITAEDFYMLRSQKNVTKLKETCHASCKKHETSITLKSKGVIAMITDDDKYGLFLIKDLTPASIKIDACHILL